MDADDLIEKVNHSENNGWPSGVSEISKQKLRLMAQHYKECSECAGWFEENFETLEDLAKWMEEIDIISFEICGMTNWELLPISKYHAEWKKRICSHCGQRVQVDSTVEVDMKKHKQKFHLQILGGREVEHVEHMEEK